MAGWSVEQVLALAPDLSSQRAARSLATARFWQDTGHDQPTTIVWGSCQGGGSRAYQTCVELAGPAYRCSCPSRKFPCKHALGLLLWWAGGRVTDGDPPEWVREWQAARQARRGATASARAASQPSEQAVRRRAERVDAGLDELARWLADQVRPGLAGAAQAGYGHWEAMSARLVDAQAPGAAAAVRRLAGVAADPERLLAQLGLLWLLVAGYRRLDTLPPDLAATVRSRVGFPVPAEQVLAGPAVRDQWQVIGVREEADENLTVRRSWLLGAESGRPALVLVFGAPGQPLPSDLVLGSMLDADVHFYPGAQPLRALPGKRYRAAGHRVAAPRGAAPVASMLDGYASALARDPWLERWPALLCAAPVRQDGRWWLRDDLGDALPLHPAEPEPWRLVAGAGGRPVPVAAEWTPAGLRPLTAWIDDRPVML